MQDSTAQVGLDVHSRTSALAWMNEDGDYRGPSTFRTSGENLRQSARQVEAEEKALTLEEGPLAFWTARVLEGVVDRTVVCDPRENYLISQSARKNDETDAKALARLLRLGEVKEVYQPSTEPGSLHSIGAVGLGLLAPSALVMRGGETPGSETPLKPMSDPPNVIPNVIVIGAGLSGLAAA